MVIKRAVGHCLLKPRDLFYPTAEKGLTVITTALYEANVKFQSLIEKLRIE